MSKDNSFSGRDKLCVAVSIVNYGTADLVLASLPALLTELNAFPGSRVFIVENASPGDDAGRLEQGLARLGDDRVQLIRSARNGGFAAGNNIAFDAMRRMDPCPSAIMLHNPDALVRPGAVRRLLEELFRKPDIGFAGARLENPDGSTWGPAFLFPSAGQEFARASGLGVFSRRWPLFASSGAGPCRADWLGGAAVLIRMEALDQIGDMDEGYFLYFEEMDYMKQGRLLGWNSVHVPDALVFHDAGSATGLGTGNARSARMPSYWFASWRRYFEKHHGVAGARGIALAHLAGKGLLVLQCRLRGRSFELPEHYFGDFIRHCLLPGADAGLAVASSPEQGRSLEGRG